MEKWQKELWHMWNWKEEDRKHMKRVVLAMEDIVTLVCSMEAEFVIHVEFERGEACDEEGETI